jgi:nucleotide-binding universal stress UspA family protein
MIDKLLLFVEDTPGAARAAAWTLGLARQLSCRVFAVAVLDARGGPRGHGPPPQVEEKAWEQLYEIEDDAFQSDVRISLLLDQGKPLARLLQLASSYEVELLVLAHDTRLNAAELLRQGDRPVVFVR